MNPTVEEVEQFLRKVADEVGANRLREFCANFAAFPASLDRREEQSSEMQDLVKTMLEYCDEARLRVVLRMLAENSEHYTAFLLE
jgi:hypothetical protein